MGPPSKHKCPSKKLRDLKRLMAFLLLKKDVETENLRKQIEVLHFEKKQIKEQFHKQYTEVIDDNTKIKQTLSNNIKHLQNKISTLEKENGSLKLNLNTRTAEVSPK